MQRSCREGYKHLRSAGETGEKCGLKNREKCRQSLREVSAKPTEGHKAFEKCGGMKPREVARNVPRSDSETVEKCRRSRRNGFEAFKQLLLNHFSLLSNTSRRKATLRTHLTLLVTKQHFPSQSDSSHASNNVKVD